MLQRISEARRRSALQEVSCQPSLTPDASGRPAGLTFAEFKRLMRTGIDPEDGHLLQVMPWPVFGKKTDRDLRAIPSLP